MHYRRFFAMIITSTLVMFGLMYLNTYLPSHIFWSETRAYMAIVMGAAMAFVMLAFMLSMYKNRAANIAIFAGSVVVFGLALWLVRSQVTVEDRSYMSAMIPHHSIAVMTSNRANISDGRVRSLADSIIYAQDKEIAEMRYLLADIAANGKQSISDGAAAPQVVAAGQALSTEVVAEIDPEFLTEADLATVFDVAPACRFTYTWDSPAVLVTGETAEGPSALMKISGDLVLLSVADQSSTGIRVAADPLVGEIVATNDGELFDLTLSAGADYSAGFRGQYRCS